MGSRASELNDLREALGYVWQQLSPSPTASWAEGTPEATPSEGPDPYGDPDPEWLRIDWRELLQTHDLGELGEVHYVERGPLEAGGGEATPDPTGGAGREATPIVFVHGLSGSWQNWLENIPFFSRHRRVVALDLPGFGHSPMPPEEISIEYYGRVLNAFVEDLGLERPAIVGNSMGGFAAAEAVTVDPARYASLVLVSAAGISHATMRREPAEAIARMAAAAAPLALRVQDSAMRRPKLREAAFKGLFRHPELLRTELLYETLANGAEPPGFVDALVNLSGYDFLDRLEQVELPTLIVWGRDDRVVPPHDATGYAERLRNSRTAIFDECGHLPMLERPTRFNRLLESLLEG
ncbi:alpha/beta fold hydrolase [soil metagenome]